MSQPSYNKYKSKSKMAPMQAISGMHHLQSLTSNAQHMLQKQLAKVHSSQQQATNLKMFN